MGAGPLVIEIICTCFLAAFLLHRYGDLKKQHFVVTLVTFISWYFAFMIIFILPLDVSSTFYRQCLKDHQLPVTSTIRPANHSNTTAAPTTTTTIISTPHPNTSEQQFKSDALSVDGGIDVTNTVISACQMPISKVPDIVLGNLWRVIYWTSQILTWLILPLMQSYSSAAEFNMAGKIKTALIENAIYYGTYLLIFGVCLIYVATRPDIDIDADKLKVICITASNTWGLFLLVLLFGYGLVEVPRNLWNSSKRGYMLSRTYFKLAKLSTEKTEAEEALEDVLDEVKNLSEKIRYNHPLRKHVDTVLEKCPESLRQSVKRNLDDFEDYSDSGVDISTEKSLVKLHKQVISASMNYRRTQTQWKTYMEKAFDLEDIAANESRSDRSFHKTYTQEPRKYFRNIYTPTVEWYWKCRLRPWVLMGLAVFFSIISFMVVWSECLFFIEDPVLSIFALFIDVAKANYDYVYIELSSILTIGYLCLCAYYTVFQIRILNLYYIAPHHQTDEYSLIFIGMILCRLTPPMCLNFLGLIHLDSHVTHQNKLVETSYTQIMGHMDVISIIADGFNIYFPILIVLLCICTYFSLGSRILQFLGFQQFVGDDDMTQELTDEGKQLVAREKRKIDRQADGEARRQRWNEKFGESTSRGASSDREIPSRRTKYSVPRSPDENDTTELLKQVEPIDYSRDMNVGDEFRRDSDTYGRYQNPASRYGTSRTGATPPRNIFDDV